MSNVALAVLLGFGAACAWAVANVYIQRAARAWGDLRAMLWAQLLGALLFLPGALFAAAPPRAVDPWLLLGTGAASALGYYGMLRAFRQGPLSVITPILAGWPLAAVAIGIVWFGEKPTALQLLGGGAIVIGVAGNGALGAAGRGPSTEDGGAIWTGSRRDALAWAVGGAIGFGAMTVGVGRLTPDLGAFVVTPVVWGVQWVVLAPLLLRTPSVLRPPAAWKDLLAMAACEGLGFYFLSLATTLAPVAVVSPPASLSTPLTVLFARVALGERIGAARVGYIGLALVGTLLIVSSAP